MALESKQLVLGIDGGGSKTLVSLAVVSDRNEYQVVGRGTSGASNLNVVGFDAAASQVQLAIQRAFESAGIQLKTVAALCMGMAGAGRVEEQETWMKWAQENQVAQRAGIVTDAETILSAGTPEGIGVALIAGTGSLAFGKNEAGEVARAGGWGYLLGDEGSGYQIAMAAMKAILKSVEGRGPETCLQATILRALELADSQALIGYVYRTDRNRSEIAALSKLVFDAAEAEDIVAKMILAQAVEDLAELVKAVVLQLHFSNENYALALTGGILLHQREYRVSLLARLRQLQIEPSSIECMDDASLGAIRIAARL